MRNTVSQEPWWTCDISFSFLD